MDGHPVLVDPGTTVLQVWGVAYGIFLALPILLLGSMFYIEKKPKPLHCSLQFFRGVFTLCDAVSHGRNPLGSSVFEKEASAAYCLKVDARDMNPNFDKFWLELC